MRTRDDTADSCVDGVADGGNGLGLYLSGATRADVVVKQTWTVVPSDVRQRSLGGIGENMDVVGRNRIRDHLNGISRG
jgi:hypothetical protein